MALSGTAGQAGAGKTGGAKCEVAPGSGAPLVSLFSGGLFLPAPTAGNHFTLYNVRSVFVKGALSLPHWNFPPPFRLHTFTVTSPRVSAGEETAAEEEV